MIVEMGKLSQDYTELAMDTTRELSFELPEHSLYPSNSPGKREEREEIFKRVATGILQR